jgi:hypothetical protein
MNLKQIGYYTIDNICIIKKHLYKGIYVLGKALTVHACKDSQIVG